MAKDKPEEVAPEQDPNSPQARIAAFIKDYGELRSKHKVDIAAAPNWIPNERGTWELIINMQPVDVANELIKSPKQFIP